MGSSNVPPIYVIAGACAKVFGEFRVELQAGMYADYPAGDYQFEVLGSQEVRLVNVWLLPEHLWAKNDD